MQKINSANECIREEPEKALSILKTIDSEEIRTDKTEAYYALLLSRAYDRADYKIASDSIITPAVNYYSKRGNSKEKAQVYYYLGRIFINKREYKPALEYLMKSKRYIDKTMSTYLKGFIYGNIGTIHYDLENYAEARTYFNKSVEYLSAGMNTRDEAYAFYSLGRIHILNDEPEEALIDLYRSKEICMELNIDEEVQRINREIADVYYRYHNDPDSALIILLGKSLSLDIDSIPDEYYLILSEIFLAIGQLEKSKEIANHYLNKGTTVESRTKAKIYKILKQVYAENGEYREAFEYSLLYEGEVLKYYREEIEKSVAEIVSNYQNQELIDENEELRENILLTIIICVIGIMLLALLTYEQFQRRKRIVSLKTAEVERLEALIETLSSNESISKQVDSKLNNGVERESLLKIALERRMDVFKKILYTTSIYSDNPEVFLKKLKTIIQIDESDNLFMYLQEVINSNNNGIVTHLKDKYPDLTEEEVNFCCMIIFGFSSNEMTILYGYTNTATVYSKRYKLRSKLSITNKEMTIESFLSGLIESLRQSDNSLS